MDERYVAHIHCPPHLFRPGAVYFITGKTFKGVDYLAPSGRREQIIEALRFSMRKRGWELLAWVALPNHYHCLGRAPEHGADELGLLINAAHRFTSLAWNRADDTVGRTIWYQYWDSCVDHVSSFYARLNYIHYNPLKHGLANDPAEYPHSSYRVWAEAADQDIPAIEDAYPWDRLDLE